MKNVLAYSVNIPTRQPQLGVDPELVLCTTDGTLYGWNRISETWAAVSAGLNGVIVVGDTTVTLAPDGKSLVLGSVNGVDVTRTITIGPDDATQDVDFDNSDGGFSFNSTTGGLVPPRMTTAQRDSLTNVEDGTIIRNTEDGEIQVYDAGAETWGGLVPPSGGGSGVESVSGSGVDNSDVHNPIVNGRPYLVYTALLTQTGTSAPVATVLENTLGFTPTWVYNVAGSYFLDCPEGGFPVDKTTIQTGPLDASEYDFNLPWVVNAKKNYNQIEWKVVDKDGVGYDTVFNCTVEIRVYP